MKYDVNEHEVIECWEQKKIVFSRGKNPWNFVSSERI